MGHVPPGPVRVVGEGGHLQGRQCGGAPREGAGVAAIETRPDPRRALGSIGEDRAAEWYRNGGYAVLDRNWRSGTPGIRGELDLVLARHRTVVFAEVKTRSGNRFGEPYEAVTGAKQLRIRRLAAQWMRERAARLGQRPTELRFDVVSIRGGSLEVLEAAF